MRRHQRRPLLDPDRVLAEGSITRPRDKKTDGGIRACLGPGEDHDFESPDVTKVVFCDRCRKLVTKRQFGMV